MNASAVRNKKNTYVKSFNNASDRRKPTEKKNLFSNPSHIKDFQIETSKEFNDKLFNEPDTISINDVLYGDYSKPKKNSPVLQFEDVHDEDKPNRKNFKLLRKFLKQEADIINKSDF